jgi:hypothetical protein
VVLLATGTSLDLGVVVEVLGAVSVFVDVAAVEPVLELAAMLVLELPPEVSVDVVVVVGVVVVLVQSLPYTPEP